MWWIIAMCAVVILTGALTTRNRAAKARFNAQHPNGISASDLSEPVRQLLRDGNRIQALRQFRGDTGLGLKDAKEALNTVGL